VILNVQIVILNVPTVILNATNCHPELDSGSMVALYFDPNEYLS